VTAYICNRLFYAIVWEHLDFRIYIQSARLPFHGIWELSSFIIYKLKYLISVESLFELVAT